MKLHFYTKESAPYSFEYHLDVIDDEKFTSLKQQEDVESILNGDEVLDILRDEWWDELKQSIASIFDKTTNGEFDWNKKTDEYFEHFDRMLGFLNCNLEYGTGKIVSVFACKLSYEGSHFSDNILYLYIPNFYCGNGEPEGAQLALDLADCFMRDNQWHVGMFDANGTLVTDIASWSKIHALDIKTVTPIVWFGHADDIPECWSITPKTSDLYIKEFWGDYFEGALLHICDAAAGLGIYYSVWEYGLDYDDSIFEDIKSRCPINIDLINEERTNALYNLLISIYNENKDTKFPSVQIDLYLKDVLDCVILVSNDGFKYSYSKPYRFKPSKLAGLDKDSIEEILLEDTEYRESFTYLKETIIDNCDLSSCYDVWKRVDAAISQIQTNFNDGLVCQIQQDRRVLASVPFSVDFSSNSFLPRSEIKNVFFIKSLIEFLNRGRWHLGVKELSQLPKVSSFRTQSLPQDSKYPVVWFNDSEQIPEKLSIWQAYDQYTLHLIWESASDFCSHVFNNIEVHNNFRNAGSPLYSELDHVFEHVKEQCPIHIRKGNEPIDFSELEEVVQRHTHD